MKTCYNCFHELQDTDRVCPNCGQAADISNAVLYPHALPCGSILNGRYIVGRVLGQGGFGITYVGQQFDTRKLVAIKEYFPDTMASRNVSHTVLPFNTDRSEGFEYGKKQFLDEAKTLSAFIGSPNIVRVNGYFEENGTAYFVMEYVRGKSLKQYVVSRGGRISWEETWDLLMPVLEALSEVHSKKIVHRDIKPDNIIITKSGSAKLIDFGAARYKHGEKSRSLTAILTPGYAPPEQYYTSGDQGAWTDVYALAATMYFCITGKTPPESIERAFKDRLEKPSSLGIPIPAYAETALLRALSVNEKERFETTYDFRNAVMEGKRREEEEGGVKVPSSDRNDVIFRNTQKKAAAGDADAQFLLGYFYEKGMGTAPDDKEAEKWYRLAVAQGNADARMKLNNLLSRDEDNPAKGQDESSAERVPVESGRLQLRGSDTESEGPQPQDSKEEDGGEKNTGKGTPGGETLPRGKDTVDAVPDTGKNDSGTSKPVSRQKGDKSPLTRIMLAVGLIALLVVAGLVIYSKNTPRISRASDAPMELTDTWEEIAAAGRDGTYKKRYRIGDTKELDIGSEGIITMRLVAMDTDELADGSGKAPMTWVADELLQSEYYFTATGEGGWEASLMRSWLRGIVLPLFPEEVRSSIREVTKSSYVNTEGEGVTTKDTIWIPSMMEVAFSDKLESMGEERQYYSEETLQWLSSMWDSEYEAEKVAYTEWFKDKSSRVRTRTGESEANYWYLRSVYNFNDEGSSISIFSAVDSNGSTSFGDDADDMICVLIGFCL